MDRSIESTCKSWHYRQYVQARDMATRLALEASCLPIGSVEWLAAAKRFALAEAERNRWLQLVS